VSAVDQILDRLLNEGLVRSEHFEGCSEDEIWEIIADQQVSRLPAEYIRFMQRIDKGAGPYLCGTGTFYPR
jgi:hypothetical protein